MIHKIALIALLVLFPITALPVEPIIQAESSIETIPQRIMLDYLAGKESFYLIDARTNEEYEAGHVYGASNVPFDSDLENAQSLPENLNTPIVVYCGSGKRSSALQKSMLAMGYSNVRVLGPRQMFWADELPVFNCGANAPDVDESITLQTISELSSELSSKLSSELPKELPKELSYQSSEGKR